MTLAKRIVLKTVVLTVALLAVGVCILTGMFAIQSMAAGTREEFDELHLVRHADRQIQVALREYTLGHVAPTRSAISSAIAELEEFLAKQESEVSEFDDAHAQMERRSIEQTQVALRDAQRCFERPTDNEACASIIALDLYNASNTLGELADEIEHSVSDAQTLAAKRFETITWILFALALTSVGSSLIIGILHYRSVVGPLRELRQGTDRLAKRELDVRLEPTGDREFVELKESFNHMAAELESLCNNLEERVTLQSKEVAVAERLASVGFLAAGVAHEVNNPLAIIAGYTESLLRRIRRSSVNGDETSEWIDDLEAIREEAFRCKRITSNLLDLSRMGDPHREPVSLRAVATGCISLIGSWTGCGNTRIDLHMTDDDAYVVHASEQEMRQIVLNLLINAVESTSSTTGQVDVSLSGDNGWVLLCVKDNGCGMSSDTLNHVFEPFYTTGKGHRGLGLGLSISHAIAQRQAGSLTAHSEGLGHGSAFTLRLPVRQENHA